MEGFFDASGAAELATGRNSFQYHAMTQAEVGSTMQPSSAVIQPSMLSRQKPDSWTTTRHGNGTGP